MLKYTKLSDASRKFLAWKWCLAEDKEKQINQDKCDELYKQYISVVTKKNNKNP